MKQLFSILCFGLVIYSTPASAQQAPLTRDSVLSRYLEHGAYRYSYHSRMWGIYIDSALALLPQEAYLYQQRGMPLFKEKKYEAGMPYLDSAVKYAPEHYLDYRAFMKCIFQKSYRAALEDFRAARALNGDIGLMDHPYKFYEGLCYLQLSRYDSARILFQHCVDDAVAHRGVGNAHYLHLFYLGVALWEVRGQDSLAAGYFDQSLKQYPQLADAKYYKARKLMDQDKFEEALALLQEAKQNLKDGYTINEDNAIYEPYPYQVNNLYLDGYIRRLQVYLDYRKGQQK